MNNKEIEEKINKLENEIAEIKKELNQNKEDWIPEENEEYWYYSKDRKEIYCEFWCNDQFDEIMLKEKRIFKTREEAERYADYQKAKEAYGYEFSKEEWESNDLEKYYICYVADNKRIHTDSRWRYRNLGEIHFKTKEQAQEFADKYEKEILEYDFGIIPEEN